MSDASTGEASLGPGAHVIGSASDADLRLPDPTVSRHHARLTCSDDGVAVEDLGSTNGTALDGMPVDGSVLITGRATLKVGRVKVDLIPEAPSSPALAEGDPQVVGAQAVGHINGLCQTGSRRLRTRFRNHIEEFRFTATTRRAFFRWPVPVQLGL